MRKHQTPIEKHSINIKHIIVQSIKDMKEKERLKNCPRSEEIKGHVNQMECVILEQKNWRNLSKICSLVNSIIPILTSWF